MSHARDARRMRPYGMRKAIGGGRLAWCPCCKPYDSDEGRGRARAEARREIESQVATGATPAPVFDACHCFVDMEDGEYVICPSCEARS